MDDHCFNEESGCTGDETCTCTCVGCLEFVEAETVDEEVDISDVLENMNVV